MRNAPPSHTRSALATSSSSSARGRNFAIISSAALLIELPCIVTDRDPPVPPPCSIRSLSPCTKRIRSNGIPARSCRNWAYTVSCPWPFDWVPTYSSTIPSGAKPILVPSRVSPRIDSM
jgi:hypothetical protein